MKSYVVVIGMTAINFAVFLVMQAVFYKYILQDQAKKTIVNRMKKIIGSIKDPVLLKYIMNAVGTEVYMDTETDRKNRNEERLYNMLTVPLIVSVAILIICIIGMENKYTLIASNGLIWMSYMTEILLFFTFMQPYPIVTNYELVLASLIKIKKTGTEAQINQEKLSNLLQKISIGNFKEKDVHDLL